MASCVLGLAIAILPIGLMYAGGLKTAQTVVLVVSLPLVFTFWLSGISLFKSLKEDHGDVRDPSAT